MINFNDWSEGSTEPPLPSHDIHVWMAALDDICGEHSLDGLSTDEIASISVARSIAFRNRFIQTRLILRQLLGWYLRVPPSKLVIHTNKYGKPMLTALDGQELEFNVSHTQGVALFAFACGRRVGIDIDNLGRIDDWRSIANSSFSPIEREALSKLPESMRCLALMRGWIRKEAYTKARGAGFLYGFTRFSVCLESPVNVPILLDDQLDPEAQNCWWIKDINVNFPLAATLASEKSETNIQCWRYPMLLTRGLSGA